MIWNLYGLTREPNRRYKYQGLFLWLSSSFNIYSFGLFVSFFFSSITAFAAFRPKERNGISQKSLHFICTLNLIHRKVSARYSVARLIPLFAVLSFINSRHSMLLMEKKQLLLSDWVFEHGKHLRIDPLFAPNDYFIKSNELLRVNFIKGFGRFEEVRSDGVTFWNIMELP